ncbi:hypothetical protein UY3_06536 [Chelonia mydas]|uniref:Uncharacterized protein n=1 Tax=Chelonia mydas TaxID=8469 RepID=M7BKE7_CHEMY|nr:hypothetical protein UY3_06536 [Chelonia mydas]
MNIAKVKTKTPADTPLAFTVQRAKFWVLLSLVNYLETDTELMAWDPLLRVGDRNFWPKSPEELPCLPLASYAEDLMVLDAHEDTIRTQCQWSLSLVLVVCFMEMERETNAAIPIRDSSVLE